MKQQTTLFSYLVYILKNNYLIFIYLFIPLLVNDYQNISYFIPLIFIPVAILMVLILPKKINEINYHERMNKSIFARICYLLSEAILLVLNIIITSHSIREIFYFKSPMVVFLVATIFVVILISRSNINVSINSSLFLFIIAILLVITPVLLVNDVKDFTLLKPFYEFKGFSFLLLFYFILDTFSHLLSKVEVKQKFSKWHFLIPITIMFIFMSGEILNIILITGTTFLLDNEFLGFFILFIQDTINYIGNLGLFFLYVIPVVGCFKAGVSLRNIKDSLKIDDKVLYNLLIFLFLFISIFLIMEFLVIYEVVYYSVFTLTILLGICYFFIIINRSTNYEIHF